MYAREITESSTHGRPSTRTLSLMASGNLWRDALVMYDRQTRSLWTQHDGRAIQGRSRAAGRRLAALPSEKMSYSAARARYPDARVLEKKPGLLGRGTESIYDDYLSRTDQLGLFGTQVPTDRVGGKDLVLGVVVDGREAAYSLRALVEAGGARLRLGDATYFAVPLAGGLDARIFRTNRSLHLEGEWVLADGEGGRWDAGSGLALEGAPGLERVPARVSAWFAWFTEHPDSEVWTGP